MAQVINTNVASLFAGASLNKSALGLQVAQERLSSGLRINSSKDDPTGLGLAMGVDTNVRSANMQIRNANDGISKAQINDGILGQVAENTQRLSEIFTQVGSTAFTTNTEATKLISENTRLTGLLSASVAVTVDSGGGTAGGAGATMTSATSYTTASSFTTEITNIATARAKYGADMVTLGSAVANLQLQSVNLSAQYSRIMDTDYAAETTNMTRNNILQQAGTAVLAQTNQNPNTVLSLLR